MPDSKREISRDYAKKYAQKKEDEPLLERIVYFAITYGKVSEVANRWLSLALNHESDIDRFQIGYLLLRDTKQIDPREHVLIVSTFPEWFK